MKNSMTPKRKNSPMIAGALPKGNESHKINFIIRKYRATSMLEVPSRIPTNAAILMGTLEWLTMPNIAISNSV